MPRFLSLFLIDLGPVIVHAPLVVNLQKEMSFAGFYVLYLFNCSIDCIDTYLKGNGMQRCQSVDQTFAADQTVMRAGSIIAQQSSVIIWRKGLFN